MSEIVLAQRAVAPTAPPVGEITFYAKTDGRLYSKTPDGAETLLFPVSSVPVGGVYATLSATAPPSYLLLNGQVVSRTTFADLFAITGTTYGVGDGSTTFGLPDLRGRTIIGAGQGAGLTDRTLASLLGVETHPLVISELANHNHAGATGVDSPDHTHQAATAHTTVRTGGATGALTSSEINPALAASNGRSGTHTHPVLFEGGGLGHQNMQPAIVLNWIVRSLP